MADADLELMISTLADLVESERAENAKFRSEIREHMAGTDQLLLGGRLRYH